MGSALAELMPLSCPAGPYHAVFASMANANASTQRLMASNVRLRAEKAAEWCDMAEVYHRVRADYAASGAYACSTLSCSYDEWRAKSEAAKGSGFGPTQ